MNFTNINVSHKKPDQILFDNTLGSCWYQSSTRAIEIVTSLAREYRQWQSTTDYNHTSGYTARDTTTSNHNRFETIVLGGRFAFPT
jgi:hypothetical protein